MQEMRGNKLQMPAVAKADFHAFVGDSHEIALPVIVRDAAHPKPRHMDLQVVQANLAPKRQRRARVRILMCQDDMLDLAQGRFAFDGGV